VRNSTLIGRIAAVAAVALAVVVVGIIVLSSGSGYQVKAVFQNASQLVNGDQVQVAGNAIGSVSNIQLTPDGNAEVTLSIDQKPYYPLHQGTEATVRLTSLSGIANRYVELRLGPGNAPKIPNNGVLPTTATTSAVDLDELFDTLNGPTRKALQNVIQGSASQYQNQGQNMYAAFAYLNPAIDTSSVLFREINRDTSKFEKFLTNSSHLVTDLATRASALSGLVQNLNIVMGALANQKTNLASSIQRLPGFMAYADTTFVNLRQLLNDLTPLVNVSKPVAPKLNTWLQRVRPFAVQAVPTVSNLAYMICSTNTPCTVAKPGNNDLIQLTELQPALEAATCGTGPGASSCTGSTYISNAFEHGYRKAAFPISIKALKGSTPELAVGRPYAADLTGWFEGFTHPGVIDANGGTSRVASNNVGYAGLGNSTPLSNFLNNILPGLPLTQQITQFINNLNSLGITAHQGDRCPGSQERGALWYPSGPYYKGGFPCNPNEKPTGP
jgi:phospholipid/cholesterol/gamma-HCH transport system substrate-binding protein